MLTLYWKVKDAGHKILYQFNSNDAYYIYIFIRILGNQRKDWKDVF